ncbi:uncharacterized protein LOC132752408 [Ruditapes philippinarum]|uniref:uncharacterized protein LOC132752408 n=1 Tax=Ruditapes philippinarum TaxID=129788 RepID=UPI00295BB186|nr:uncharacterized protein LOC132752408 [Ruditapes philippinarum]
MKRIVHIGYILLGFILLNTKVADCITCLSCHNIADLSNCKEAIVCTANQTCYIEKILSPVDFKPVYNTGCKELDYCKLQLCNKNAYGDGNSRKKRVDNDLVLCSECCFQDSCNAEGCGYKQPSNNITQCFKCDEVYMGGPQCTETEDCDLQQYVSVSVRVRRSNRNLA